MIILLGESASGKSSIEKELVKNYGLSKLISYTTRPKRKNEKNGIDYNFVHKKDFKQLKSEGFFAETTTYNNWFYGTAKKDYLNETKDKVIVLSPYSFRQIKKIPNIEIMSFYIQVPRRERLIKCLQRGDNVDETIRRNFSDIGQFDGVEDEVDVIIKNPLYKKSISNISKFIYEYHNSKLSSDYAN